MRNNDRLACLAKRSAGSADRPRSLLREPGRRPSASVAGSPAADRVSGPALDFCLLVTQRRVVDDLALEVTGDAAAEWMSIAQAFAGGGTTTDPARAGL